MSFDNMPIPLDLTSFEKALLRLEEALQAYAGALDNALYRDATIQRFEFTYEVAHKMLKRHLEMTVPNPAEIDEMAFADMIRTGSEQGLLRSGWDKWKGYRKARGTTRHTYDEAKAMEVAAIIPDFLSEVRKACLAHFGSGFRPVDDCAAKTRNQPGDAVTLYRRVVALIVEETATGHTKRPFN